jgi:hypothetical protein
MTKLLSAVSLLAIAVLGCAARPLAPKALDHACDDSEVLRTGAEVSGIAGVGRGSHDDDTHVTLGRAEQPRSNAGECR